MKVIALSASLIYFLATTSAVSAYLPQPPTFRVGTVQRRDASNNAHHHVRRGEHAHQFEKRAPAPQESGSLIDIDLPGGPSENPGNTSTSTSTTPDPTTTSTTTPPQQPPPNTTTSTTSTPTTTEQPNTTTTPDASHTTSAVTTTINTQVTTTGSQGTTIRNTNPYTQVTAGTRTASQGTSYIRSSTSSSATSTSTSGSTPFMKNKGAVAATAVVVSLVAVGALVFVGFWLKKKQQRGKMGDDTWDEASMKEFPPPTHGAGASVSGIVVPPPLMTSSGGLGRSNTVLPSQSAGVSPLARTKSHSARSHEDDSYGHHDEPDEILAMPPVKNYERPRDSAFDIVPPPPPAAVGGGSGSGYSPTAYSPGGYNSYGGYGNAYASTSAAAAAGLEPPAKRKGDHTSYGSGVGNDPFAGTGFVDATRESSYGPGAAGRGAGYNMGPSNNAAYDGHYGGSDEDAYDGNAVAGPSRSNYQPQPNQWGQAYNPYQGYGQASGSGSKGYGGYGYAN